MTVVVVSLDGITSPWCWLICALVKIYREVAGDPDAMAGAAGAEDAWTKAAEAEYVADDPVMLVEVEEVLCEEVEVLECVEECEDDDASCLDVDEVDCDNGLAAIKLAYNANAGKRVDDHMMKEIVELL